MNICVRKYICLYMCICIPIHMNICVRIYIYIYICYAIKFVRRARSPLLLVCIFIYV